MSRVSIALLSVFVAGAGWSVQAEFEFWPGVRYDTGVPTFSSVLGYDAGTRITSHTGIIRYMEALAAAVPSHAQEKATYPAPIGPIRTG